MCDVGAVTACQFSLCQTTLLEQQSSPCSSSCGEKKERISAQGEEQTKSAADTEHCLTDLPNKTTLDELSAQTTVSEDLPEEQNNVTYSEQECEVTMKDEKSDTKKCNIEGSFSAFLTNEQSLCAQLGQLETEDSSTHSEVPCLKELLSSSEDSKHVTTFSERAIVQMSNVKDSSVPSLKASGKAMECWDEYIAPTGDTSKDSVENTLSMCFVPPVCTSQSELSFSGQQFAQQGYHFAVGPGLANEVQCPLWQFPAVSYYPTMEPTVPFEVMWRVWEDIEDSTSEAPPLIPFPFTKTVLNFTVMSYNILSQDLLEANQDLYTHCPLEVLEWSCRCRLLLEEIQRWVPDIVCLQEVQENHFHQQLHPVLTQMGYTCVYKRRTGSKTDGCATCYRSSCFAELSVIEVEFFRPDVELLDRHNVAVIVLLHPMVVEGSEVKAQGPPLCVANTHLLFNPRRGDIKLAQLAILLAEMDKVVKSCRAKGEHCNIILCGDFNSVPNTPLYQLITQGELYFQGLPAWMISGQEDLSYKPNFYKLYAPLWPNTLGITDGCQYTSVNQVFESHRQKAGTLQYSHEFLLQLRFCPAACERPHDLEMIPGVTDVTSEGSVECLSSARFRHFLSHRLDLQSVYKHVLPGSGNAEVTTLHSQVGATVDYIFYSPRHTVTTEQQEEDSRLGNGLKLVRYLTLLSEDVLWSMNGLPSHIFPSDHLSLLAKFQVELNAL